MNQANQALAEAAAMMKTPCGQVFIDLMKAASSEVAESGFQSSVNKLTRKILTYFQSEGDTRGRALMAQLVAYASDNDLGPKRDDVVGHLYTMMILRNAMAA